MVDGLEQQAIAAGRRRPEHYAPTRPPEAEAAAIDMVALAAQATGCPAYIVHVSSEAGLPLCSAPARRGVPLWAETCPQYILMNDARCGGTARWPASPRRCGSPPTRRRSARRWRPA